MAEEDSRRVRWWRRWTVLAPAAVLLVLVLAIGLVHTAPVRREVLRRALVTLQDRLNIRLSAGTLSYNLFALRMALSDVVVAATAVPDVPFARAARVTIDLPWSSLFGRFAIDDVLIDNARVHVVRREDGTTNLPTSAGEAGEPGELPLGRLRIRDLAVDISDRPSQIDASLPRIAVDIGRETGTVRLLSEGSIKTRTRPDPDAARSGHATRVTRLEGDVAFDGRVLRIGRLHLATDEGASDARGTLALLVADPRLDLSVRGSIATERVMGWVDGGPAMSGPVEIEGRIAGAFGSPSATARLRSTAVIVDRVTLSDLSADVDADARRLQITRAEVSVEGGRASIAGVVDFEAATLEGDASWSDVDTGRFVRTLAPDVRPHVSGRSTGTARIRAPSFDPLAGTIDVRNEMRAGPAAPGALATTGTADLGVANGRWTLRADHAVAAVRVRANVGGRMNARSVMESTLDGRVDVTAPDLPAALRTLDRARLLASRPPVNAGAASAGVRVAGTLGAPSIVAIVHAEGLDVADIRSLSAELTARGTQRQLAVDMTVRQAAANTVRASGTVWPARQRLDVKLTGDIADLRLLVPSAPVGGTVALAFDAAGPFDAIAGRGTVTVSDAVYDTFALGRIDSTVDVDGTRARIEATARELGGVARMSIALAAPHHADIALQIDDADVARLVRDQVDQMTITGRLTANARGSGPLDDWRSGSASVDVSTLDARANDLAIRLSRPATLSYSDGRVRVGGVELGSVDLNFGETHASLSGSLPVEAGVARTPGDALHATVTGDLSQLLKAVNATGFVDMPLVDGTGPLALLARVTGSMERPAIAADLELGPGSVTARDLPPVTNVEVRAHVDNGWLELRALRGSWQESALTADARVPLRFFDRYLPAAFARTLPGTTGNASVNARATSLTPRVLEPFVDADTMAQLKGAVDAEAHFESPTATIEDVRGELRLDRLDLEIAGLPVRQREPTRIAADGGFARIAAWDWVGQGATLAVRGQVRLVDRQAAILANGRVDLRTLTPFVRDLGLGTAGTLEPRLSITGVIDNPRIDGDVTLTGGELRLTDPRVAATGVTGRAVLSLTGARITTLQGGLNGGTLTADGLIEYRRGEPLVARLTTSVRDAALEFPEGLRSDVDADLVLNYAGAAPAASDDDRLTGAVVEPAHGSLTGTVTVARSSYREPLALATGLLATLRNRQVAAAAEMSTESLANHLTLDVRVITDDDLIVDNNYGRLQIGADLRVIGAAAAPALSGRAELREGGQLFLGRNIYTIESGTIDFANPVTIEPDLNITANTRAGDYDIELAIKGTPDNLEMIPTNPDLSPADAWSVLITGRQLDEISGDEAQIVGEQVLSYLSGDVLGYASRAVGLDTIRLGGLDSTTLRSDPTAVASEIDPTSRLTFGKSIGRNVDITFSQSFRDSDAQTWIVDYRPSRQLELRLVAGDDDLRAYELRHDVPFGTARRAIPDAPVPARRATTERRVAAVMFAGTLQVPEQRLREVLHVTEGDRVDYAELQRDRDRIERLYWSEGRFEARVSARAQTTDGTVTLAYDIEAGPKTSVVVNGYAVGREAVQALHDAWARAVFDGFLEDEAVDIVRRAAADEGYLRAEVVAGVTSPSDGKVLTVTVTPGERTTERRVRLAVTGDPPNVDLERWLRAQELDVVVWRDPGRVAREIAGHLRALGHVQATARAGAPVFDGQSAAIAIEVTPGPVFTIGRVAIQRTAGQPPDEDLLVTAGLVVGSVHDGAAVEGARDRLVARYRREGFAAARVTGQQQPQAARAQVDVTFEVVEGPRQVLGEISVQGNRAIDPDVIVRTMALPIGEPLGADAWLQARKRVFDTGLFRRVDISTEPARAASTDAGTQSMRVRVVVEEWPALRLRYGVRIAEEWSEREINDRNLTPGLSAEVTRRTLFGRAITLGGSAAYQHRERNARAFISAPTLIGWPIRSSLTLERSHEDVASVVTDRSRIAWEQRMFFTPRLQLSYSYSFDQNHTFDTTPSTNPFLPAFDVFIHIARLNGAAAFDTRNDPTDTARGSLLSASLEYAPQTLGSDIRFVKFVGQAYHFRPWQRLVFASAARLGTVDPLGDQELILSERFFTGGARSVRGVDEDSLGPRGFFGEAAGGGALLVLNQEVRFPIYKWLRGVGAIDAGNVFDTPSDLRFTDLVGSSAVGARLTTPFGTVRVDYGRRWSGGSGRWTFGIGQTF